jgi:hypothetical protein
MKKAVISFNGKVKSIDISYEFAKQYRILNELCAISEEECEETWNVKYKHLKNTPLHLLPKEALDLVFGKANDELENLIEKRQEEFHKELFNLIVLNFEDKIIEDEYWCIAEFQIPKEFKNKGIEIIANTSNLRFDEVKDNGILELSPLEILSKII